ncbi:hypothetical protein BDN72DRAFT_963957 [Pluteus cervinus]|uniref:Uncharacterized protein n=1 Tax=Pluteus cervinus TaxID=181527 RepID=A0ACD3AD68_9AGAR|nr:hypothetical protein BDN72DRAFT_963957 [Pluteus cervinus]
MDELRLSKMSDQSIFVDLSKPYVRQLAQYILPPLGMQVSKNADITKDTINYWMRGLGTVIRVLEESLRKNDAKKATECLGHLVGYSTIFNDRAFLIWLSSSSVLDCAVSRGTPSFGESSPSKLFTWSSYAKTNVYHLAVFRGPIYQRCLEQPDTCNRKYLLHFVTQGLTHHRYLFSFPSDCVNIYHRRVCPKRMLLLRPLHDLPRCMDVLAQHLDIIESAGVTPLSVSELEDTSYPPVSSASTPALDWAEYR